MGTGKGSNSDNIKNENPSTDSGGDKTKGPTSLGSWCDPLSMSSLSPSIASTYSIVVTFQSDGWWKVIPLRGS
jgi:hypothetical protein